MTAWLFPAGEPHVREAVATDRLTNASAPRDWSVDVNRKLVKAGDYRFFGRLGTMNILASGGLGGWVCRAVRPTKI
jgi:hypothetical protein